MIANVCIPIHTFPARSVEWLELLFSQNDQSLFLAIYRPPTFYGTKKWAVPISVK